MNFLRYYSIFKNKILVLLEINTYHKGSALTLIYSFIPSSRKLGAYFASVLARIQVHSIYCVKNGPCHGAHKLVQSTIN